MNTKVILKYRLHVFSKSSRRSLETLSPTKGRPPRVVQNIPTKRITISSAVAMGLSLLSISCYVYLTTTRPIPGLEKCVCLFSTQRQGSLVLAVCKFVPESPYDPKGFEGYWLLYIARAWVLGQVHASDASRVQGLALLRPAVSP